MSLSVYIPLLVAGRFCDWGGDCWFPRMLDFRRETWWLTGETSSPAEGLIPSARLCANKEATVFFLGFDVPRPRLRGRLSCYMKKTE